MMSVAKNLASAVHSKDILKGLQSIQFLSDPSHSNQEKSFAEITPRQWSIFLNDVKYDNVKEIGGLEYMKKHFLKLVEAIGTDKLNDASLSIATGRILSRWGLTDKLRELLAAQRDQENLKAANTLEIFLIPALARNGHLTEARTLLDQKLAVYEGKPDFPLLNYSIECYISELARTNLEEAMAFSKTVTKYDPHHKPRPRLALVFCRAYMTRNDTESLRKALAEFGNDFSPEYNCTFECFLARNGEEVGEILKKYSLTSIRSDLLNVLLVKYCNFGHWKGFFDLYFSQNSEFSTRRKFLLGNALTNPIARQAFIDYVKRGTTPPSQMYAEAMKGIVFAVRKLRVSQETSVLEELYVPEDAFHLVLGEIPVDKLCVSMKTLLETAQILFEEAFAQKLTNDEKNSLYTVYLTILKIPGTQAKCHPEVRRVYEVASLDPEFTPDTSFYSKLIAGLIGSPQEQQKIFLEMADRKIPLNVDVFEFMLASFYNNRMSTTEAVLSPSIVDVLRNYAHSGLPLPSPGIHRRLLTCLGAVSQRWTLDGAKEAIEMLKNGAEPKEIKLKSKV
jgi:hypothetical protein